MIGGTLPPVVGTGLSAATEHAPARITNTATSLFIVVIVPASGLSGTAVELNSLPCLTTLLGPQLELDLRRFSPSNLGWAPHTRARLGLMKAVVFSKAQGPLTVEEVPDPSAPVGGVVIDVMANGVCRSDWHAWMGHDPTIALPHVPGHEMSGVISEVGADLSGWSVGDRVTIPFSCGCGVCDECNAGNTNICEDEYQPGFSGWGAFAEKVALPYAATNLVRLPDGIDFTTAASLGCRFMTAFHGLTDRANVQPGEWVAVHGCGGVGLSVIQIAKALGAKVIAVDLDNDKLELASSLGADVTVNGANESPVKAIRGATNGGAHISVDALGAEVTAGNSIRCLRRRGRHIQIGLVIAEGRNLPIPMTRVISLELEIYGSHGMPARRYPELFDLITSGAVDLPAMVGKRISLQEAPAELAAMGDFTQRGVTVIEF